MAAGGRGQEQQQRLGGPADELQVQLQDPAQIDFRLRLRDAARRSPIGWIQTPDALVTAALRAVLRVRSSPPHQALCREGAEGARRHNSPPTHLPNKTGLGTVAMGTSETLVVKRREEGNK